MENKFITTIYIVYGLIYF